MDDFSVMQILRNWQMYSQENDSPIKTIQNYMERIKEPSIKEPIKKSKEESIKSNDESIKKSINAIMDKYIMNMGEMLQTIKKQSNQPELTQIETELVELAELVEQAKKKVSDAMRLNHAELVVSISRISEEILNISYTIKSKYKSQLLGFQKKITQELMQTLQEAIPSESALNLISKYTPIEIKELSYQCLALNPKFSITTKSKSADLLRGYINQHKLNQALNDFGFIVANDNDEPITNCRRLIITTHEVFQGLNTISTYLNTTEQTSTIETLKTISASDIFKSNAADHSLESTDSSDESGLEIAWGLLGALIKHAEDKTFVTTSFEIAEQVIPKLSKPNATLIIDGHGGKVRANFADIKNMSIAMLQTTLAKLIALDESHHIDHVILQSCASGDLISDDSFRSFIKNTSLPGKLRQIIIPSPSQKEAPRSLFMSNGTKSFAETAYEAINKTRNDVAFTFSENLINPGDRLEQGNVGVLASKALVTDRPKWPRSVLPNDNGRNPSEGARKSCTIIPSEDHRKFKKTNYMAEGETDTKSPPEGTSFKS